MENKKYKIYRLKYLENRELTDDDLYWLFDTPSFDYSLVVGMFKMVGYKKPSTNIIDICKTDEQWMYKYFWTIEQKLQFEDILTNIYKNLYQYGDEEARHNAQWWIFYYGLTLDTNKNEQHTKKQTK